MKKSISIALSAMLGIVGALASPVTQQRAADVALAYVSQQKGASTSLKVASVGKINDGVYLVNFSPAGFALVSADDNALPILGFSTTGSLNASQMPDNMAYMMSEASDVVSLAARSGNANPNWRTIETGLAGVNSRANGEPVDPLIRVKFNQTSPYNQYCPGEDKTKALVGCVAVAMSQAMSVQRYPSKPQGIVSYVAPNYGQLTIDLDAEAPYNWDDIISGANKNQEAARLLYHAGMSVHMDYGSDGSGIPANQVYRITNALRDNFSYPKDVNYYWRKDYTGDWTELLLNELYAGRALVYNAQDTKGGYGHSFNIDGYNGALFHVNWGWGGYGDGYFSIDALADAQMSMNYDSWHVVVTGIGAADSSLRGISLPDHSVEENSPAGTTVSAVLINGELPTSDVTITVTGAYNGKDYDQVPFKYQNGQLVTTRPLAQSEGPIYVRVVATLKSDKSVKLSQGFSIEIEKPQTIEHKTSIQYDRASKMFTVHTKYNSTYSVKNAQGAVVVSGAVSTLPEFTFSRDQLSNGTNVLEIAVDGKTYSVNIVK